LVAALTMRFFRSSKVLTAPVGRMGRMPVGFFVGDTVGVRRLGDVPGRRTVPGGKPTVG